MHRTEIIRNNTEDECSLFLAAIIITVDYRHNEEIVVTFSSSTCTMINGYVRVVPASGTT